MLFTQFEILSFLSAKKKHVYKLWKAASRACILIFLLLRIAAKRKIQFFVVRARFGRKKMFFFFQAESLQP